jgi:hypothetical protein
MVNHAMIDQWWRKNHRWNFRLVEVKGTHGCNGGCEGMLHEKL